MSDTDESDTELAYSEKLQIMLELKCKQKHSWKNKLKRLSKIRQYQYLSAGLLLPNDKYPEIKKKAELEKKKLSKSSSRKTKEDASVDYRKVKKFWTC